VKNQNLLGALGATRAQPAAENYDLAAMVERTGTYMPAAATELWLPSEYEAYVPFMNTAPENGHAGVREMDTCDAKTEHGLSARSCRKSCSKIGDAHQGTGATFTRRSCT